MKTMTRRESSGASPEAVLFRLGGDEFTIPLDVVDDPRDAMRVAKSIQVAAAEPFFLETREGACGIPALFPVPVSRASRAASSTRKRSWGWICSKADVSPNSAAEYPRILLYAGLLYSRRLFTSTNAIMSAAFSVTIRNNFCFFFDSLGIC